MLLHIATINAVPSVMDDLGVDRPPEASTCLYGCAMVMLLNKNVNNRAIVSRWMIC